MPEMRRHLIDSLNRRDGLLEREAASAEMGGDALERQAKSIQAVLDETAALVRAVEARDPYTTRHAQRVAEFAKRIADEFDPARTIIDREGLELGCRLLDIGKLGLGDSLLNTDAELDKSEREAVERHPAMGRNLLLPLLDNEVALAIVAWHHERWDGTGYPDRLGPGPQSLPRPA